MTQQEISRAFRGSPMTRAKLRGLRRNAAVVSGNVGTSDDADVLARALDDVEPLMREHAACALERLDAVRDAPTWPRSDAHDAEPWDEA